MNVGRWVRRLRDTADLGDIALVHELRRPPDDPVWRVYEVTGSAVHPHLVLIGWGPTPRQACRDALRTLRGRRIRTPTGGDADE